MLKLKQLLSITIIITSTIILNNVFAQNQLMNTNWKEEFKQVYSEKALTWVEEQNKQTKLVLDEQNIFRRLFENTHKILTSDDRIPYPYISIDNKYINFWQDSKHIRGILRQTNEESYHSSKPKWDTIINFDELAKQENKNWIYKGSTKGYFHNKTRYLLQLSDGGTDASEYREFDIKNKKFVENGFYIPEAKSYLSWYDENNLLVATNFGAGTISDSGYPIQIRLLGRNQDLNNAKVLLTTDKKHMLVAPTTLYQAKSRYNKFVTHIITDRIDFYNAKYYLLQNDLSLKKINIPDDAELSGLINDKLFFILKSNWHGFKQDSIIALDLIDQTPELVLETSDSQSVQDVVFSKNKVYVHLLDDVNGKVLEITPNNHDNRYTINEINLPKNGSVSISFSNWYTNKILISYEDFITPVQLYKYNSETTQLKILKSLPSQFDNTNLITEQKFVLSDDGTKIPYYLVRRKDIDYNGSTPTLLYGYGGFEISLTPSYSAVLGKNWLERGNAYALANIRGGGEYGSKWHQAALRTNRHKAYEDFSSIAKDLINSNLTSPRHLAIRGGSNGGLLMGVMLTKYPQLFNAVICSVPLLDMLEYHTLLAGASWIAEYGDPNDSHMYQYIKSYSPLQNLVLDKSYPEIFVQTSTKDDRVHPYHARIFAHTMQKLGYNNYYFEDTDGGHSNGANLIKKAQNEARNYTYLIYKTE